MIRPHSRSGQRVVSAGELVVALCHQYLAGLPFVAQRPVPGGYLLIRLRGIAGCPTSQQLQPIPGPDLLGHPGVGQPVHREAPVGIGRVLQARWVVNEQRPTHPCTRQFDRHIIGTIAGGGELAAEEQDPVHLQAVGGQGGPGVVTQLRPSAIETAADVGTD